MLHIYYHLNKSLSTRSWFMISEKDNTTKALFTIPPQSRLKQLTSGISNEIELYNKSLQIPFFAFLFGNYNHCCENLFS